MADLPVPWVEGKAIGETLAATIAAQGANDALVFPQLDLRLSYSEFGERVEDAARGLLALGIRRSSS